VRNHNNSNNVSSLQFRNESTFSSLAEKYGDDRMLAPSHGDSSAVRTSMATMASSSAAQRAFEVSVSDVETTATSSSGGVDAFRMCNTYSSAQSSEPPQNAHQMAAVPRDNARFCPANYGAPAYPDDGGVSSIEGAHGSANEESMEYLP